MPTHAELASKLLNDAADFFIALGQQSPQLTDQMAENAAVFRQMSDILLSNPAGDLGGTPHGELAGKLLIDASTFFSTLAAQNPGIQAQMEENARVFQQVGELVTGNPLGILD
jgi:hypothetical protein